MSAWNSPENLADRDAYFSRLASEASGEHRPGYGKHKTIAEYEACQWCATEKHPDPKDSGVPVVGALNANLSPSMLPFEDFVSDVCHIQHPFCD